MLIIKRVKKVSCRKEIDGWIKKKLQLEDIKIIKVRENKEAGKVFFQKQENKRCKGVWERKEEWISTTCIQMHG